MHLSFETLFFRYTIGICVVILLFVAGVYAYLGTFSRYRADDYCEAVRISRSSPVAAVFERYFAEDWPRATMRYSNLLFVGISESLGGYNMQFTVASMVLLWFAGCVWSVYEIRRFLGVEWFLQIDLFLGLTFGFFCMLLAPNLFQTVYWRSAMVTHFAPLVFGLFLFSFLIKQAGRPDNRFPSLPVYFFILAATFVIAGFSEPPTTTLLTATLLLLFAVWFWGKSPAKRKYLALLASVFSGALLGLLVMLLSPASVNAAQEKTLDVVQILMNSFIYSYFFIIDSLKTRPLPIFLSMLVPLMLIWLHGQTGTFELSRGQKRIIGIAVIVSPFLAWLLIAAGFSPSVYGQSFPIERMRFLARAIVIATFMLEGALFGLLLGHVKFQANPALGQSAVAVAFAVIAIGYPIRTAVNIFRYDLPEYGTRAGQWDARDAYIRQAVSEGAAELVVVQLDTIGGVQEYKDNERFWVNRCASDFYGLRSLRAP